MRGGCGDGALPTKTFEMRGVKTIQQSTANNQRDNKLKSERCRARARMRTASHKNGVRFWLAPGEARVERIAIAIADALGTTERCGCLHFHISSAFMIVVYLPSR